MRNTCSDCMHFFEGREKKIFDEKSGKIVRNCKCMRCAYPVGKLDCDTPACDMFEQLTKEQEDRLIALDYLYELRDVITRCITNVRLDNNMRHLSQLPVIFGEASVYFERESDAKPEENKGE